MAGRRYSILLHLILFLLYKLYYLLYLAITTIIGTAGFIYLTHQAHHTAEERRSSERKNALVMAHLKAAMEDAQRSFQLSAMKTADKAYEVLNKARETTNFTSGVFVHNDTNKTLKVTGAASLGALGGDFYSGRDMDMEAVLKPGGFDFVRSVKGTSYGPNRGVSLKVGDDPFSSSGGWKFAKHMDKIKVSRLLSDDQMQK